MSHMLLSLLPPARRDWHSCQCYPEQRRIIPKQHPTGAIFPGVLTVHFLACLASPASNFSSCVCNNSWERDLYIIPRKRLQSAPCPQITPDFSSSWVIQLPCVFGLQFPSLFNTLIIIIAVEKWKGQQVINYIRVIAYAEYKRILWRAVSPKVQG